MERTKEKLTVCDITHKTILQALEKVQEWVSCDFDAALAAVNTQEGKV